MKKKLFNLYAVVMVCASLVIIALFCLLAYSKIARWKNENIVSRARPAFLRQVKAGGDEVSACVYDKKTLIFVVGGRYYFSFKNGQAKLLKLINGKDAEAYPAIARDDDFIDAEWLSANCL